MSALSISGELTPEQRRQRNLEFLDVLVGRMELMMELRTYQRYGIPDAAIGDGDYAAVIEPLRQQIAAFERRGHVLRTESRKFNYSLPFDELIEIYQLDRFEQEVLTLALAPMLDAAFRKRIARYKDNILLDFADVDLVLSVLLDTRRERLSALAKYFGESSTLVRSRLVKLIRPKEATSDQLLAQEIVVPGRVVNHLLRSGEIDHNLTKYARMHRPAIAMEHVVLPQQTIGEVISLAQQYAGTLRTHIEEMNTALGPIGRSGVLQFVGPSGTGKTHFARAVAAHLNAPILEVDCGKLASEDARFKTIIEDLFWQARIAGAVLVLERADAILGEKNAKLPAIFSEFERWQGLAIIVTLDPKAIDASVERWVIYQCEFEPPEMADRERLWAMHLPSYPPIDETVDVEFLASQFEITGNQIRNAALVAANMALADAESKQIDTPESVPTVTLEHFKRAAHTQMRASLSQYARKSKVKLTLDDLILPDDEKQEIQSILDAAQARTFVMTKWGFARKLSTGKGLVMMFCGEPGTGKTLCAEIMANTLGLQLYQISIPQVMSKYIGETEKNIAQIFQTAKANHAMLLFDEADSLFTSRVKVESSVDKFSNMETNLLLQEIERFEGIIILTTNLDKSIDKAFQRRIQFKVTFPFPDAQYRAAIWELLFPRECPVSDEIDWELVGKSFEISGGHIKNAVLRAAYRAKVTGGIVDMETIRFAAEQECKQAGKLFRSFKLAHEMDDEAW
ncbi:MAG: ATP-binding protein [Myxococcota bacterium]|nr:ATP-binding protein [Myxococcota bacterium]